MRVRLQKWHNRAIECSGKPRFERNLYTFYIAQQKRRVEENKYQELLPS